MTHTVTCQCNNVNSNTSRVMSHNNFHSKFLRYNAMQQNKFPRYSTMSHNKFHSQFTRYNVMRDNECQRDSTMYLNRLKTKSMNRQTIHNIMGNTKRRRTQ